MSDINSKQIIKDLVECLKGHARFFAPIAIPHEKIHHLLNNIHHPLNSSKI